MNEFNENHIDLNDKSILVTGGTGSFGNEFVRIVLKKYKPKKLIVFSRDEMKQYQMAQSFPDKEFPCIRYFIGDVRDSDRLEMAMREVDYVVHAAALKHIQAGEYNPFECIRTNVYGAENVVKASIRANVKRIIALSTDKAANPINLYGASKLAADKIFIAANNLSGLNGPKFSVVRYGNVIGSRGSLIPLFQQLIRNGAKSIPITDKRMSRFWITLNQGVNFVLSSFEMMRGTEIFVPKIPSMKIINIASIIAENIPHEIIGIRPGEKLHEVLITKDDARNTLELDDRYIIQPNIQSELNDYYIRIGAARVGNDFNYTSDSNIQLLNEDTLKSVLNDFKV